MRKVLFVAGDLSGDGHAARVARELKAMDPNLRVLAAGGPGLSAAADRFLADIVGAGVMGFWEPVKRIPWFRRVLNGALGPVFTQEKPDAVVAVDFFGFNRFVIARAKAAGLKVAYFISPQVWASRPGRVEILKKFVDRMLVIFPFEEKFYRERGVPVRFVGHPLLDVLPESPAPAPPMHLEPVVGLLPGSRASEVRRHLPLFLAAADRIAEGRPGMRFVLFAARSLSNEFYDGLLGPDRRRPYLLEIVRDENFEWRTGLDLAITCSGSATLENALLGIPMIVAYRTSWPTYALARALVRVTHIAMPNLLAGKTIVPELIQSAATPDALAAEARGLLDDPSRRRAMRRALIELRASLGAPGAARRAAAEILSLMAWTPKRKAAR